MLVSVMSFCYQLILVDDIVDPSLGKAGCQPPCMEHLRQVITHPISIELLLHPFLSRQMCCLAGRRRSNLPKEHC